MEVEHVRTSRVRVGMPRCEYCLGQIEKGGVQVAVALSTSGVMTGHAHEGCAAAAKREAANEKGQSANDQGEDGPAERGAMGAMGVLFFCVVVPLAGFLSLLVWMMVSGRRLGF